MNSTRFKMRACKLVTCVMLPLFEMTFMLTYWIVGLSYFYSYQRTIYSSVLLQTLKQWWSSGHCRAGHFRYFCDIRPQSEALFGALSPFSLTHLPAQGSIIALIPLWFTPVTEGLQGLRPLSLLDCTCVLNYLITPSLLDKQPLRPLIIALPIGLIRTISIHINLVFVSIFLPST